MKKIVLVLAGFIIVAAGLFVLVRLQPKKDSAKPTAEYITELFSQKYQKPTSAMIVQVTSDTGGFAKGTVNEPGAGGAGYGSRLKPGTAGNWFLTATALRLARWSTHITFPRI